MLTKMVKNGAPEAQCFAQGAIASPSAIDATTSRLQQSSGKKHKKHADAKKHKK